MKKIRLFQSDGLYLARSCASANTLFFENANDHELFFNLLEKYLGEMIEIIHYAIIPTAWIIVFRTRSESKIKGAYNNLRDQSIKAKAECTHTEVNRMISEHFRIFNAQLVRKSNALNMRHGSKVHSRFEKFIFENKASVDEEIEKMEALLEFNQQWLAQYNANLGYYDPAGELNGESELKSAKRCYSVEGLSKKLIKCFMPLLNLVDVVRKLISSTWTTHFGQKPPPELNFLS